MVENNNCQNHRTNSAFVLYLLCWFKRLCRSVCRTAFSFLYNRTFQGIKMLHKQLIFIPDKTEPKQANRWFVLFLCDVCNMISVRVITATTAEIDKAIPVMKRSDIICEPCITGKKLFDAFAEAGANIFGAFEEMASKVKFESCGCFASCHCHHCAMAGRCVCEKTCQEHTNVVKH